MKAGPRSPSLAFQVLAQSIALAEQFNPNGDMVRHSPSEVELLIRFQSSEQIKLRKSRCTWSAVL